MPASIAWNVALWSYVVSDPAPNPTPPAPTKPIDWAKLSALLLLLVGQVAMLLKDDEPKPPSPPSPPSPVVEAEPELVVVELPDGTRTTDAALEVAGAKLDKNGTWIVRGVPKPGEKGWMRTITVSTGIQPEPPKPPEPPTPPTPPVPPAPVPIPAAGFRVLLVEEKDDRGTIPQPQLAAMFSTQVRDYLNRKCAKGPDGKTPEWRFWDKDVVLSAESETWQKIWTATKPQLTKLPAVVVINGTDGKVFDMPADEAGLLALLKQYGGE